MAWPVWRQDSFSQVSAPKSSFDCGMVKNTQRRSPVRASNACTAPGASNLRCTWSGVRLPTITRVFEYDRRRRLVELGRGHRTAEIVDERDAAALAESRHRSTGVAVNGVQPVAAVDEDAEVAAAAPDGYAPVLEAVVRVSALVRLWIEDPQLFTRLRVERRHAVVHRREIQHVVDHHRRRLERPRPRPELRQRHLARIPLPRDLQLIHVGGRDLASGGILGVRLIGAHVRPLNRLRGLLPGERRGTDGSDGGSDPELLHPKPIGRIGPHGSLRYQTAGVAPCSRR